MAELTVYILNTSSVKERLSYVLSILDKNRIDKGSKFVNEKDQLQCYGAGYLIRKYLPNKEILEHKNGKPYFAGGPFFNISHSGNFVALAVHETNEVGVDIERIDEKKVDAIKFTLNEQEKQTTDIETLFRMWSNKESLLKCMSSNLNDIKKLNGFPLEGSRLVNEENYYSKSMIYDGYSLSVTLKQKEPFEIKINQVEIKEN